MPSFEQKFSMSADKEVSGDQRSDAEALVSEWRRRGREQHPQEKDKTEQEVEFINKLNSYLSDLYTDLDIGDGQYINVEQIHIFSPEAYRELRGSTNVDSRSAFRSSENTIMVHDTDDFEAKMYCIAHEVIHAVSHQGFHVQEDEGPRPSRLSGFTMRSPNTRNIYFRGLNEAITEETTRRLLGSHSEELKEAFNVPMTYEEEIKDNDSSYSNYIDLVDALTKRIAIETDEDPVEVYQRFQKGMFTGNMMVLRDIERTLGKGSLRLIANVPDGYMDRWPELYKKLTQYLSTNDFQERVVVQEELAGLLVPEERDLYNRRLDIFPESSDEK